MLRAAIIAIVVGVAARPARAEPDPCDVDRFLAPGARVARLREPAGDLARGRVVITADVSGDLVCVWSIDGGGISWVPSKTLAYQRDATAGLPGRWISLGGDERLTIHRAGKAFAVDGKAVWHGWGDNTHEGEVHGTGEPRDGVVEIVDEECVVRMRAVGPYLVVTDNRECGGVNVAFEDVYRRRR